MPACHVLALTDVVITPLSTVLCDTCRIMSFVCWRMFTVIVFNSFTGVSYHPPCPFVSHLHLIVPSLVHLHNSLYFCTRLAFVTTSNLLLVLIDVTLFLDSYSNFIGQIKTAKQNAFTCSPYAKMNMHAEREDTSTVQLEEKVLHSLLRCCIVIFNGSEITVW